MTETNWQPVRVLWITKGLGRGGTERILDVLARVIPSDRVTIDIAFTLPHKNAFVSSIEASGRRVVSLGRADDRGPHWVLRLVDHLRANRYDVIHTHSPVSASIARLIPAVGGPAFVHTEYSAWDRYHLLTRAANRITYSRNRTVLALSDAIALSIRRPRWIPGRRWPRVERVYHGIDTAAVRSGSAARAHARRVLGLEPDAMVVGCVASFTPKKNLHALIKSFGAVGAAHPGAQLVLIGDGPQRANLEAVAAEHGADVLFTGVRDDVQVLLPALDVFVLPSIHEGLGLAALEALAAGIPCVASNVGGLPEVLGDGVGVLVDPAHPGELRAALIALIEDEPRRHALASRGPAAAERFNILAAAERLRSLYDELAGARTAREAEDRTAPAARTSQRAN